jgi:hypothetical protein
MDLRSQHLSRDATRAEVRDPRYAGWAIGQSADVVSVWVVPRGEEFPRFVTAYPEGDR